MKRYLTALAILAVLSAPALAACPSQSTPQFNAGGSVFGRIASQWNVYFGAKADVTGGCIDNGTLNNPLIVGGAFQGTQVYKSIVINSNMAVLPAALTGTLLQVGNIDGTATRAELDAFGAGVFYTGRRANGTNAAPTGIVAGNEIVDINAYGFTSAASWLGPAGRVGIFGTGTWSGTSTPTEIRLSTTASGSTTLTDRWHVGPSGGLYGDGVTGGDEGASTINALAYRVGGALLAASNLSNGTTGSGAVALANGPTFTTPALGVATATSVNFGGATLDTYVATTWTPTITTDATAGTPVYSIQVGSYEQIGRQVTLRFHITLSSWGGSPTGNVAVGGFPVASGNVTNDNGSCVVTSFLMTGVTSFASVSGFILPNTSLALISAVAAGGGLTTNRLTATNLGTFGSLSGTCFYHT